MRQRSREEKLAAYSKASKRGYRARQKFLAHQMKEPSPGEVKAQIGDLRGIAAGRALGNAGPGDAAQDLRDANICNAMVAQPMELSTSS